MRFPQVKFILFALMSAAFIVSCGGSGSNGNGPAPAEKVTYSTTSTRGDYSEWSFDGNDLSVVWQVIDDTGQIDYTHTVAATCAAANSTGIRECSITTAGCADGVSVCSDIPSGSFKLMDVPGVALFVNTDDGVGGDKQLHVGFAKNVGACADDVSGDYTFIRTGLGLRDSFGMYRSDDNFINIQHSDFGFATSDSNATQTVTYNTGTESEMLGDISCVGGVRTRNAGGNTIRSMMTASGLFVLDLPAGEGGLVSFKVGQAATLADMEGKTFGGISYPDNSDPEPVLATFGTISADKIDIVAESGGNTENLKIMDLGTADISTNPAYPDFAATPTGYGSSALSTDYPNPDAIPGLFKLEKTNPGDSGRVIMAALKFNNKVIAVGMVYNFRDTTDIDPSAGDGVTTFSSNGLYNTGNFLVFEM